MEYSDSEIEIVTIADGNIVIKYANNALETLPVNKETYTAFYNLWLKDNPPFISDSHKIIMRNLILATINNNQNCLNDLNAFFASGNEETVKKFLTYMRKRELTLPAQKAIWTKK
jgi:hypothetical protein